MSAERRLPSRSWQQERAESALRGDAENNAGLGRTKRRDESQARERGLRAARETGAATRIRFDAPALRARIRPRAPVSPQHHGKTHWPTPDEGSWPPAG